MLDRIYRVDSLSLTFAHFLNLADLLDSLDSSSILDSRSYSLKRFLTEKEYLFIAYYPKFN